MVMAVYFIDAGNPSLLEYYRADCSREIKEQEELNSGTAIWTRKGSKKNECRWKDTDNSIELDVVIFDLNIRTFKQIVTFSPFVL